MAWGMSCGKASTVTSLRQRDVGVGLLGERDAGEVHVEHAAAHGVAAHVINERRHLAAIEAGERKKGRVAPATIGELERVLIGLDRRRVGVAAVNDARKQTLAAKGVHLLTEYLARTDAELLCFGHD